MMVMPVVMMMPMRMVVVQNIRVGEGAAMRGAARGRGRILHNRPVRYP
jgi:hypothetical protein